MMRLSGEKDLACFKKSQETNMAGVEWPKERLVEEKSET